MNGLRLIRRHAAAFGRFAGLGSGITLAASATLVLLLWCVASGHRRHKSLWRGLTGVPRHS
jgi:hypothetical protein